MKLFVIVVKEQNGEQEYSNDLLAKANSNEDARKQAREYCAKWYDSDEEETDEHVEVAADTDHFEFMDGAIVIDIQCVTETTEKAYKQTVFDRALI